MANKILVEIVTPNRIMLSGHFNMVVVRSVDGEMGILSDHMPLIASLIEWPVKLKKDDDSKSFISVSGGFMEVRDNKVTILATAAELDSEIDIQRATASKERAEKRLGHEEFDQERASAALRRALGRLQTLNLSSM